MHICLTQCKCLDRRHGHEKEFRLQLIAQVVVSKASVGLKSLDKSVPGFVKRLLVQMVTDANGSLQHKIHFEDFLLLI